MYQSLGARSVSSNVTPANKCNSSTSTPKVMAKSKLSNYGSQSSLGKIAEDPTRPTKRNFVRANRQSVKSGSSLSIEKVKSKPITESKQIYNLAYLRQSHQSTVSKASALTKKSASEEAQKQVKLSKTKLAKAVETFDFTIFKQSNTDQNFPKAFQNFCFLLLMLHGKI
jgi:hypothetical protein